MHLAVLEGATLNVVRFPYRSRLHLELTTPVGMLETSYIFICVSMYFRWLECSNYALLSVFVRHSNLSYDSDNDLGNLDAVEYNYFCQLTMVALQSRELGNMQSLLEIFSSRLGVRVMTPPDLQRSNG